MVARLRFLASIAAVAILLVAACGSSGTPSEPELASSGQPSAPAAGTASPGTRRPVLIDTDLGVDDILAIAILLRDPSVDVRAITVTGTGLVHCDRGTRNLHRLLGVFGVPGLPVGCGRSTPGAGGREFPAAWRDSSDNLYGVYLPPVEGATEDVAATRLIADTVGAGSEPLTVVALGPWTNLADAFTADPTLPTRITGIHAMAATIDAPGNVDLGDTRPADRVEWNVGADPEAFARVLAMDVPVTLVPLDATDLVAVPPDLATILEPDHAAAGADLAYEMYLRAPWLVIDSFLWDQLAVLAFQDPTLVTWEDMRVKVQPTGPASGRLSRAPDGRPVRAAMSTDPDAAITAFLAALRVGAPRPDPFVLAGELSVTWDGTACRLTNARPVVAGDALIRFTNQGDATAVLVVAGLKPPHAWAEIEQLIATTRPGEPVPPPDWLVQVAAVPADALAEATIIAALPPGTIGAICASGTEQAITYTSAGAMSLLP